jgi:hypothetical protein
MAMDRLQYQEEKTEVVVVQEESMTVRLTMAEVRGLRSLLWNGSKRETIEDLGLKELSDDLGRPLRAFLDDTGYSFCTRANGRL